MKLPINSIIDAQNTISNWKWRNAARDLIERDNVLSIDKIKELFNHIMNSNNKILSQAMMEDWLLTKSAKYRLMGISSTEFKKTFQVG
ncbi:hypothetical protein CS369_22195 [Candidatus Symbiopectobacterium sp. 'North America']|uniref:hypothetical protein n=1 Tax=Candidatus Symbiopectobacterium sp. 'North America' TaxID=2794574 RepID=UPI0018C97465|nr:hypothetical protein [Candidatus Symbiopectobacterium sp. 'North America']MBG6246741.1 hypothetical protein [Candidatus Symbiopectobacterium sp. 'North America']